jgi:hypothetical protein
MMLCYPYGVVMVSNACTAYLWGRVGHVGRIGFLVGPSEERRQQTTTAQATQKIFLAAAASYSRRVESSAVL